METALNPVSIQNFGAGIVALFLMFWGIWYYIKNIVPALEQQNDLLERLCESNKENTKIICNNTTAIHEISKSNENVATALNILDITFKSQAETFRQMYERLQKHDERAERIENLSIRVNERIDFAIKK